MALTTYIGRLAPSPTGYLHLGHARTFLKATQRSIEAGGRLLLRNDDLDTARCRPEFTTGFIEDLHWLGLTWEEPMITQSRRLEAYREALTRLHDRGLIFPCDRSRKEIEAAAVSAPHEGMLGGEPIYPSAFRPPAGATLPPLDADGLARNWRFRVPAGETLSFHDGAAGPQSAVAGRDFGDFLVWRKDGLPSYQLACAVDDAAFGITEVVRGADLIRSTFRQLLIIRALGAPRPAYWHCPLITDEHGERLAKRHHALALRKLKCDGTNPETLRARLCSDSTF